MQRRRCLELVGAGSTGAVAGCLSSFTAVGESACTTGDDPIETIDLDLSNDDEDDRYTDETYEVQGTITEQSPTRVVIDDGTGLAVVSVKDAGWVFDTDEFDVGDCIGGTGPLRISRTGQHEVPHIGLEEESFGSSEAEVVAPPERPDLTVDLDYSGIDEELTITVRNDGSEVRADDLVVRWRPYDSDTPWTEVERAAWHELSGIDVDADEVIPDGSQYTRETSQTSYSVLWITDDRGWSRELDSLSVSF
ncbi:hypothetical protein ACLI4Z_02260 [Natrialbaceae archaeon A-arb3/5]